MFGCLVRQACEIVTNCVKPANATAADNLIGASYISVLWVALGSSFFVPNCLGCFVMGILFGLKGNVDTRWNVLLGGLGTGFCGSLTTFATWMVSAGEVLIAGFWLEWINLIVLNLMLYLTFWDLGLETINGILSSACVVAANKVGKRGHPDTAAAATSPPFASESELELTEHSPGDKQVKERGANHARCNDMSPERSARAFDHAISEPRSGIAETAAGVAFVCILVLFILLAVFDVALQRTLWFSVALAPVGALLRWALGLLNVAGPRSDFTGDHFPMFTAVANFCGTLLTSMLAIGCTLFAETQDCTNVSFTPTVVLLAVGYGVSGSLSTVSTFVTELKKIRVRPRQGTEIMEFSNTTNCRDLYRCRNGGPGQSFKYGSFSVGIAQIIVVCTLGTFRWVSNPRLS